MFFKWFNIAKRLSEQEERCEKLEKAFKGIELEWDTVYEKFRLLNMRLSKRVQQLQQAPSNAEGTQPEGEQGKEGEPQSLLTPRQREAQARILARRNRMGVQ
jgi:hypothetical protein